MISCATHSERADAGEQITIRFFDARSLALSSSVSPPGWMSVGAKNTGFIGLRFHPYSLHRVVGIL